MTSQEEVVVRLGLDTRDFDRRLRESDAIAKKYGNQRGAAMNQDGGPQGWQSIGNLSKQSQEFLKHGGGINGMLNRLGASVSSVNPHLGGLVGRFAQASAAMGAWKAGHMAVEQGLSFLKRSFLEVKEAADLDVSVSFLHQLDKAADMAGESFDDAKGRVLKFQQVLAAAAEGNKDALGRLAGVGIKDPTGKTMEENLRAVGAGLENITDKAQQAKAAVELFGKGAQTSMPDILKELGTGKRNMAVDEAAAINAGGWKAAKRAWGNTGGAFIRNLKDAANFNMSRVLEGWGVEAEVNEPSKLEKTESAEAKAAREAKALKYGKDLAEAKREYAKVTADSLDKESKLRQASYDQIKIQHALKTGKLDELEKTKLLTEEKKKQHEIDTMTKQIMDQKLNYENRMLQLEQQRSDIIADRARAMDDRNGWTVGELASSNMANPATWKTDRDGKPIIPDDVLRQREGALGRNLTVREIQAMRGQAGDFLTKAGGIQELEQAAKMDSLFGGKFGEKWQAEAMGWRKGMSALTSGEQDPFMSFAKNQEQMTKQMDNLVTMAANEGIKIQPRMGK